MKDDKFVPRFNFGKLRQQFFQIKLAPANGGCGINDDLHNWFKSGGSLSYSLKLINELDFGLLQVIAERFVSAFLMSSCSVNAPVALIIFNRPELTAKVFEAIRQAKPQTLIVIADGPRTGKKGEAEACAAARSICEQVDWPCRVVRHYSDKNLGCRNRVSSGLDLVFNEFDRAIILEDDCVPEPSFFRFCDELLEYYQNDERVMAISGDNFQFGNYQPEHSYYFSLYPHVWGWATWKRAWQHYDVAMPDWSEQRDNEWLAKFFSAPKTIKFWQEVFQSVYDGKVDTWDHQWTYACWRQNGLTALPSINLISNIGFGDDATHTRRSGLFSRMQVQKMNFPLQHPAVVERDFRADSYTQQNNFDYSFLGRVRRTLKLLRSRLF